MATLINKTYICDACGNKVEKLYEIPIPVVVNNFNEYRCQARSIKIINKELCEDCIKKNTLYQEDSCCVGPMPADFRVLEKMPEDVSIKARIVE